jgi:hypothetical protein
LTKRIPFRGVGLLLSCTQYPLPISASSWESSFAPAPAIWSYFSEPRSKSFAWLAIHNRVLTADNMLKRSWPCDHFCSFCYCINETTPHILTECNFTEAVWNIISASFDLPSYGFMAQSGGPDQWLRIIPGAGSKKIKRKKTGILLTFWWIIWKERNKRIFEHKETSAHQLAVQIKEAILLQHFASRDQSRLTS